MSGPSQYVRQKREEAARRRLEMARILRDDPATTNKTLASVLGVNRNTITQDRKIMVDELTKQTLSETELLRAEMVGKLQSLNAELERHRRDGKLPTAVIHEMLLVHRSLIELLGIRKPVTEQVAIEKRTITFTSSVVSSDGTQTAPKTFTIQHKQLALSDGEQYAAD